MEKMNFENIVESVIVDEIRKAILNEDEKVQIMLNGEPVETYENGDAAATDLAEYKRGNPDKDFTIRKVKYDDDYIDKMDEMGEALDNTNESMEKEKGCGCGLNENHKAIQITEDQINTVVKNLMEDNSLPGLSIVQAVQKVTEKETGEHAAEVNKKIADHENIKDSDRPEFPDPNGGEKVAEVNSEEEEEFVEDNRGGTMLNLDYDTETGKIFQDRMKKSLEGHPSMGNSQEYANVIKSDTGKNMAKNAARKKIKDDAAPMYNKDEQPVKSINENVDEDIARMKRLYGYHDKTQ